MFSTHKKTNRTLALFTFLASLILYVLTMAPTASFWDAGEFIAVAHGLEVNHPPGAPFYSLLGRLFSMFMPASYVAVSINFISALASALTVMLLYLIIVRLVREWKGAPEQMPEIQQIGMFGGALIGALTFAVTDTFWFNAVEAEVYAVSMFFTAVVVWLALVWAEKHDKPNNERWLILIAYLFGIALGIHLLNLLALFFVALIIYFKKKEFELVSLAVAGVLASLSFLVIYPFTVQMLPSIMENMTRASYGLIGPVFFMTIVVALIVGAIYYTHKNNNRLANIIAISYAMILIGYSSYALIFIRSAADPPIDENDPETVEAFISYLEREQYGNTPLLTGNTYDSEQGRVNREEESFFPRRYSTNPQHSRQYAKYSSDLDFFLSYQVSHMYVRYFNWNFIGREADIQDAGWQAGFTESQKEDNAAHNSYFYIPFLLGLFGMLFHFQNDWKRALSVLVLFIMTGLAIIVFLNQTPMQPRERDYAYVGSFFAFAIWIGMGSIGILELIREYITKSKAASFAAIAVLFCASPLLMGLQNFDDHDRSERYVAPDYAYNLLQSVAPNGILFTNGDNDTFPLWYLQEVEEVRTDVRIVNLSLLNTDWYIKQLRDQWSHESPPLPISYSNEEIEELTSNLPLHQPDTMSIPVNKDLLRQAFSDSNQYRETIGVKPDTSVNVYSKGIGFGMPVDSLDNEISWYYEGRPAGRDRQGNQRHFLQVQDQVILNILQNNKWLRPVYFANTVSSQSQMGLQPYFRFEGKAFRIVPQQHNSARYGWLDPSTHASRLEKFRFRQWNNPDAYFDENIRRMLGNYRFSVTELANKYKEVGKPDSANYWLKWGEERIPFKASSGNLNSIALYAYSYASLGNDSSAVDLAEKAKTQLLSDLEWNMNKFDRLQQQLMSIEQDMKSARENANMTEQQNLKTKQQQVGTQRKQLIQQLSYAINHYTIIQRIYYMSGLDAKASNLADQVNNITSGQLPIPTTKEENKKRFNQLQIN
jgi:MFS family permease